MSRIFYLPSLIKELRSLSGEEAQAAEKALVAFDRFIHTGGKAEGLGFKKLASDKYEIRTSLKKRIVMKKIGRDDYLALYGSHADIERFLKRQ